MRRAAIRAILLPQCERVTPSKNDKPANGVAVPIMVKPGQGSVSIRIPPPNLVDSAFRCISLDLRRSDFDHGSHEELCQP